MSERFTHRLEGLEPDNFLAFMALLGLLRALEATKPGWRPRAFWDVARQPWRPVLSLAAEASEAEIAEAAAAGVDALAQSHDFGDRKAVDFSRNEAIAELDGVDRTRRALFECLLTPSAYKETGEAMPTPYCLMFGQGHQHFLERFQMVPKLAAPTRRRAVSVSPEQALLETLFLSWRREDATDSFRWDPQEANRYALRARNPSGDAEATDTQHSANRLAAIALPLLPVCAVNRKGKPRTLAVGAHFGNDGEMRFAWPIWSDAATHEGITALLCVPSSILGVHAIMKATRVSLGKLMNVSAGAPEKAASDLSE